MVRNAEKHNAYNNAWSKKNRDKVNLYHRNWTSKRKEFYSSLKKGKSCVKCGESHPACLDFHHKVPSLKIDIVRSIATRSSDDKKVLREIKKCILLCANCHRKIHFQTK